MKRSLLTIPSSLMSTFRFELFAGQTFRFPAKSNAYSESVRILKYSNIERYGTPALLGRTPEKKG